MIWWNPARSAYRPPTVHKLQVELFCTSSFRIHGEILLQGLQKTVVRDQRGTFFYVRFGARFEARLSPKVLQNCLRAPTKSLKIHLLRTSASGC